MCAQLKYISAGFLALISISFHLSATPANDLFANRTILTGTNLTVLGDNTGATLESGEPTVIPLTNSVWYEWTAPSNGIFYFSAATAVSNFLPYLTVYQGTALTALTVPVKTSDGGIQVVQGEALEIQIASLSPPSFPGMPGMPGMPAFPTYVGTFILTLSELIPAATSSNDLFSSLAEITTPTCHFDGGIYAATSEPGEPLPATNDTHTLWWHFHAPSDGLLSLTANAAGFTPVLTIYTNSTFATMAAVPPLTGTVYIVNSGQDYYVQMAAGYVTSGQFSLDTQFNSQSLTPTNDMFGSSAQVIGTNISYYGNFASATAEPGEPAAQASNTVWVSWVAPCTGHAYSTLARASQPQYVNLYTGASIASLQPLPLPSSAGSFLAISNTVYYFQLCGGANTFFFSLWVNPLTLAANDNFTNSLKVWSTRPSFGPASMLGATMEPGEPAHMSAIPEKSLWWTWQAPEYGTLTINDGGSLASNPFIAVYTGNSVGTLSLVTKATNSVTFAAASAQFFQIAIAVPTNAVGDVYLTGYMTTDTSVHPIPGNLLQEPSWEGTGLSGAKFWHWSLPLPGYVNDAFGDCDGMTWPILPSLGAIWQSFSTIPGHVYGIQFGYYLTTANSDGLVEVFWNTNEVGVADLPGNHTGYWNWANFSATADSTTTQITFSNLAQSLQMDDFSVVDETAPPAIVTQPSPESTESGGIAEFFVNATGSLPLNYQWYFQNAALAGQSSMTLVLGDASTNQTGNYFVTVSNNFGVVTSQVASLRVDAPSAPTIVLQPYGQTVALGGFCAIGIAALGTQPLSYQWSFNGVLAASATNATLTITNVQATNAGTYQVVVTNSAGIVYSLPVTLTVSQSLPGGGTILFDNQYGLSNGVAPVFDIDGVTLLNGGCVAQLYAGPSVALIRAVGVPVTFQTGYDAGYVPSSVITLPTVLPGSNAFIQMRAWDPGAGGTFEQARALGGKFGESSLFQVVTGGWVNPPYPPSFPNYLTGLRSFTMQAGLPEFNVGVIQFVSLLPGGNAVWSLTGQSNSIYSVEQAAQDFVWNPYLVLTNTTGTVTFTNSVNTNSTAAFYRARILD